MRHSVCIVIPVYKPFERLKPTERIAWEQCLRVLSNYTICLAHPKYLNLDGYKQALVTSKVVHSAFAFANAYFADIFGYNRLMLSKTFYQAFGQYEYMLLYQLDAYVFEDKLPEWCDKGYSYVGAPWFKGFVPAVESAELWQVGNGGFSLRRIPDCLRVLTSFSVLKPWAAIVREETKLSPVSWPQLLRLSKRLLLGNNTYWRFNDYDRYALERQEDYFWGVECAQKFNWYNVPAPQEALTFSFEIHPRKMYELNEYRLPMGCHAWEKYDPDFWNSLMAEDRR